MGGRRMEGSLLVSIGASVPFRIAAPVVYSAEQVQGVEVQFEVSSLASEGTPWRPVTLLESDSVRAAYAESPGGVGRGVVPPTVLLGMGGYQVLAEHPRLPPSRRLAGFITANQGPSPSQDGDRVTQVQIPRTLGDASYDTAALREALWGIRQGWDRGGLVLLAVEAPVPWQAVVTTLDAIREVPMGHTDRKQPLYPRFLLARAAPAVTPQGSEP